MLYIENVSKKYGKKEALSHFSIQLTNGVYGLLGPNGAGKTTLINIIVGLLEPTNGNIFFNGINIKELKEKYFDAIGYCPQFPSFYNNYTPNEFLKYICIIKGIKKKYRNQKIKELLEFVNLTSVKDNKIGSFSGGMKQRMGIAQAVINNPKVLILDEPTAGLDPKERIRFRNLISKLSQDRVILLATHIVSDIEYIAKQVILLKNGKLIKEESPINLIEEMQGKVWQLDISNIELEQYMNKYVISNANHIDTGFSIRVINNKKINESAINAIPNLEDVYLYYFEGEGRI